MKLFDYIEKEDNRHFAYLSYVIDNYDKYMLINFGEQGNMRTFLPNSPQEMCKRMSTVLRLGRGNHYIYKRSDFDLFLRKGIPNFYHVKKDKKVVSSTNKFLDKKMEDLNND